MGEFLVVRGVRSSMEEYGRSGEVWGRCEEVSSGGEIRGCEGLSPHFPKSQHTSPHPNTLPYTSPHTSPHTFLHPFSIIHAPPFPHHPYFLILSQIVYTPPFYPILHQLLPRIPHSLLTIYPKPKFLTFLIYCKISPANKCTRNSL